MVHLRRNLATAGLSGVPLAFSWWYTQERKLNRINNLGCTRVYQQDSYLYNMLRHICKYSLILIIQILNIGVDMKTMYAECDSCGELDDLTETWYYVGATNGPEEDTAFLCPSCQNNDEAIKDMRDELWAGAL